jgi:hypothetical protein
MPVQQILNGPLQANSNNLSLWFSGASYLFFIAPDRPDWSVDGSFTEIDAALLVEVPGGLARQVPVPLGMISTREPMIIPIELARSGTRMRLLLQVSDSVVLEGYAVSEAAIAAIISQLQLREIGGQLPIPREAVIDSATGVLSIGKDGGPAWHYLPEGYGPAMASQQALQQIADDLASLRSIVVTDADLDAEIAEIQIAIDALFDSGASDAELAQELGPIRLAIDLLSSEDDEAATAIFAIQQGMSALDATYATDQQLAQAIASIAVLLPIRSTSPPTTPTTGSRWIELRTNGSERYPWPWYWTGTEWRSTWQLIRSVGSGLVKKASSAAPRLDFGYPPTEWIEGWRVLSATVTGAPEAAGVVVASAVKKIPKAASLVTWSGVTAIDSTGGAKPYPVAISSGELLPLDMRSVEWALNNTGISGWQGDLVIVLEAVRKPGAQP